MKSADSTIEVSPPSSMQDDNEADGVGDMDDDDDGSISISFEKMESASRMEKMKSSRNSGNSHQQSSVRNLMNFSSRNALLSPGGAASGTTALPPPSAQDRAKQEAEAEIKRLAQQETRLVRHVQVAVFIFIFVSAAAVAGGVFLYSRRAEQANFVAGFNVYANQLQDAIVVNMERKLAALNDLSVAVTTAARTTEAPYPTVTIPSLDVQGANARILADSVSIAWSPMVTAQTRADWEAYTKQTFYQTAFGQLSGSSSSSNNNDNGTTWLQESYQSEAALRNAQDAYYGNNSIVVQTDGSSLPTQNSQNYSLTWHQHFLGSPNNFSSAIQSILPFSSSNNLNRLAPLSNSASGPFLPLWQLSPILPIPAILNLDLMTTGPLSARAAYQQVLGTGRAVMGAAANVPSSDATDELLTTLLVNLSLPLSQYRQSSQSYDNEPVSPLMYPVTGTLVRPNATDVVGVLTAQLYWRSFFTNVFASQSNANGLYCVVQNSLDQTWSYRVDGPDVTFLGVGDIHPAQFNDMVYVMDNIWALVQARASPETRAYTVTDLDTSMLPYTIHIYPSVTLQYSYVTNQPAIFTAIIALVFAFTSIVFLLYDILVKRKQSILMNKAVQSGSIVSSLYPKAVRDRLFETNPPSMAATAASATSSINARAEKMGLSKSQVSRRDSNGWKSSSNITNTNGWHHSQLNGQDRANKSQRKLSMGAATAAVDDPPASSAAGTFRSFNPIADLYPDTTVLFADISGFTKWSSSKTPAQVFELLEALYSAFDEVAVRRDVFKVETIGDCYVAVTGLPEKQPDHALRMVKFANDCMIIKGMELLNTLSNTSLGPETKDLGFRIGLHSGPVTAGVLRGEKSRFQLFGDTMNTASRMESNGMKGKIHISQTTADELIKLNKSHWIVPRADKIVAKGKGEMQTYWIEIKTSGRRTSDLGTSTSTFNESYCSLRNNVGPINAGVSGRNDSFESFRNRNYSRTASMTGATTVQSQIARQPRSASMTGSMPQSNRPRSSTDSLLSPPKEGAKQAEKANTATKNSGDLISSNVVQEHSQRKEHMVKGEAVPSKTKVPDTEVSETNNSTFLDGRVERPKAKDGKESSSVSAGAFEVKDSTSKEQKDDDSALCNAAGLPKAMTIGVGSFNASSENNAEDKPRKNMNSGATDHRQTGLCERLILPTDATGATQNAAYTDGAIEPPKIPGNSERAAAKATVSELQSKTKRMKDPDESGDPSRGKSKATLANVSDAKTSNSIKAKKSKSKVETTRKPGKSSSEMSASDPEARKKATQKVQAIEPPVTTNIKAVAKLDEFDASSRGATSASDKREEVSSRATSTTALTLSKPPELRADTGKAKNLRGVNVPPGPLGIKLESSPEGPVVCVVESTSPLNGAVFPGDIITQFDSQDTVALSAEELLSLMARNVEKTKTLILSR